MARVVRLDELDRIDVAGVHWHPVRKPLGITAFGINAYSADAGEHLIEEHDESASGAVGAPSPWEFFFSGAGRPPREAYALAAEGLEHHPDHGALHYNLACFASMAGMRDEALDHLRIAFEREPKAREWAADDADLDAIRDDPRWPA